jgi:hypothetical protein
MGICGTLLTHCTAAIAVAKAHWIIPAYPKLRPKKMRKVAAAGGQVDRRGTLRTAGNFVFFQSIGDLGSSIIIEVDSRLFPWVFVRIAGHEHTSQLQA